MIEDLTLYDPYRPQINGRLLEQSPAVLAGAAYLHQSLPPGSCQHAFYIQPRQTTKPELDERPSPSSKYQVTAFCRICCVHVSLRVDYSVRGKGSPCPSQGRPLHHLIYSDNGTDEARANQRSLNAEECCELYIYECSVPQCSAVVTIKLSPAELTGDHVNHLVNLELLKQRTDEAFEVHKADTVGMKRPSPVDVLVDLRTYFANAWNRESTSEIRLDNKRFAVRFGPQGNASHDLLTHLRFERKVWIACNVIMTKALTDLGFRRRAGMSHNRIGTKKASFSTRHTTPSWTILSTSLVQ